MWWDPGNHSSNKCAHILLTWHHYELLKKKKKCNVACFFISAMTLPLCIQWLFDKYCSQNSKHRNPPFSLADSHAVSGNLVFTSLPKTACKIPLLRNHESRDLQILASFMRSYEFLLKLKWSFQMDRNCGASHVKNFIITTCQGI